MPVRPINLAILDVQTIFRKVLISYLSEQVDINVSIQASDMVDLLNKLKFVSVDILLMDLFIPGLNIDDALKTIRANYPDVKLLVLSMSTDMDRISGLLDSEIYGYISKADEPEDLIQAIRAASENRTYRNKLLTEAFYWSRERNVGGFRKESQPVLSDRETRIIQLIWEEKSNKEIADHLYLGIRSVEKIRQDMKEKIGAKSTVGLLKYAINREIIKFDPKVAGSVR